MTLTSIIIVNYNAGKLLQKSIKSAQSIKDTEVIVVDNTSSDGSLESLKKTYTHKEITIIESKINLGFGKAVNLAVEKSKGENIFLLNPDAILTKSALSHMQDVLTKYNNRAIIAPRLLDEDGTSQASCYKSQSIWNAIKEFWLGISGSYSKYLPKVEKTSRVYAAVAAAWLMPRAVWQELRGFSSRFFLYFEDIELCDRANRLDIPIIYDPESVVSHGHGVSSRTNPNSLLLFKNSAIKYHGLVKKTAIDLVIRIHNLFVQPITTKKIIGLGIIYSITFLTVMTFGYFALPSRYTPSSLISNFYHSNFLLWSWANFDGAHYLNIAKYGYQNILGQSEYAFFPLFPLLINLLSRTGIDLYLSAHIIVGLAFVGFVIILLKWARSYISNPIHILLLILLSPGAIFLFSIYTEPLFLFLTILTFYFADRDDMGKATIFAALATATRVNGIFLIVFLIYKFKKSILPILGLSGLFSYMTYLYLTTGNAMSWYIAQSGWGKANPTLPWVTLSNYLRAITIDFHFDLVHLVVWVEVLVTTTLIYLLIKFWRHKSFDLSYKLYCLGNLTLPLITGSLGSIPRFSLLLFPLFMIIPRLDRRIRFAICTLFVISCMLGIVLFTRGYWYA